METSIVVMADVLAVAARLRLCVVVPGTGQLYSPLVINIPFVSTESPVI
jgi:hypothetical protein